MENQQNTVEITALLSAMLAQQSHAINAFFSEKETVILSLEHQLQQAQKKIAWFEEQLKLNRLRQFGRSSESSLQLDLVFDEAQPAPVEAEPPASEQIGAYTRKKKSCGRKIDTSKLLREQRYYDLPDDQRICRCGQALHKIGEETSEDFEHIPEQLKLIEHIKVNYGCRACETITAAPTPEAPIPKSMASASLLADVIIKKYQHHLPLYRQAKIFSQQGLEIPDNTLGNWVMQSADALMPLGNALFQQLVKIHVLQGDETPVKVLNPEKQGTMWVYHSCTLENRFVLFEFHLTRSGEVVNRRLADFQGILQTDGYSGYNALRQRVGVISVGCWDHARRKFVDVIKVSGNNTSGKAGLIVGMIAKLYQIESAAKGRSFAERKALRQEKAKPIVEKIHAQLQKINAPPQSSLGKAVTYTLNQWVYLSAYLDYGEVEISNCWVENQIRPFALGRKNWMFIGNEQSGSKSALLYSLIQTCILNKIDPRRYLIYVLGKVHAMRRGEIDPVTLLPQFINKIATWYF